MDRQLSLLFLFFLCLLSIFPDLSSSTPLRVSGGHGDRKTKLSVLKLVTGGSSSTIDPTRVTQISWRPRAFVYRNFLTDEECDHLVTLAKDKLEKSMVADNESGKSIESEVRTSSGMFLSKGQVHKILPSLFEACYLICLTSQLVPCQIQLTVRILIFEYQDEVVANVEARIAAWTFLPKENGESIQILHYEHGQKYEPHYDYFHDKVNQELGGHRVATVLMYLSDVEKGGETIFPNSKAKKSQPKGDDWSDCAKNGYAVKPRKGDALLFFSLHLNATTDPLSLHGSCPVIEGEKWSATKWIHVRSFETLFNNECQDQNPNCSQWAVNGECEKNPLYMVGSGNSVGHCRKSCKVCS
ncbi:hypothetical protein H5410_006876 [Solanum commersonii]|uniref:procollagen-proline 4-dioxygenase n=1 Tax=Solanum commersonii TaxID=4109 RepID=A0A9J6ABT1_SOLCO|nr:hypothetical protein H5410_006876 [Solanum commersonii]